ncbi:MAG TPA: hypothetical protein VJU59_42930 [Paraburkholderia sp.]|nr:hypothetical protein [Paraburkholderia sp.]
MRPEEPLGYFNIAGGGAVALHRIPACPNHHIPAIGVAEVYWADLPRDLARRGDTMDESRAWAYTVAGRAKAVYRKNVPVQTLKDRNFARAAGVIEEIAEGVGVLENLTMIAAKAGLFHFELAALLEQYVGGIQLPADFEFYRNTILARFHGALTRAVTRVMQDVEDGDGPPEIYIFAHSEGTVISFAGIMQALLLPQERPERSASARMMEWVTHLRGFMTFGSPLDKHILLWPSLWKQIGLPEPPVQRTPAHSLFIPLPKGSIRWHNYYDYADPVAFDVSEARTYLGNLNCTAFDWVDTQNDPPVADYGFNRYPWPGEAHVEYWNDDTVFEHFFFNVMLEGTGAILMKPRVFGNGSRQIPLPLAAPRTKASAWFASRVVPYFLFAIVLLVAVALLVSAVNASLVGGAQLSFSRASTVVLGLSAQLGGLTVAARLPRVRGGAWRQPQIALIAIAAFVLGTGCAWLLVGGDSIAAVWVDFVDVVRGLLTGHAVRAEVPPSAGAQAPSSLAGWTLAMLCAVTAGASGWIPHGPRAGRPWLIGMGTLWMTLALLSVLMVYGAGDFQSLWRVCLSAAAYLYLWWVGIVLFDLTYVWHYYIWKSGGVATLRAWARGRTWP